MADLLNQFDEDSKLFDHLIIDEITHWDCERKVFIPVRLELFGHSIFIINKSDRGQNRIAFNEESITLVSAKNG
jgi:hypothetical protein